MSGCVSCRVSDEDGRLVSGDGKKEKRKEKCTLPGCIKTEAIALNIYRAPTNDIR